MRTRVGLVFACAVAAVMCIASAARAQESDTAALHAAALEAQARADSMRPLIRDWRWMNAGWERDTVLDRGSILVIWRPWSDMGRRALTAANDSIVALFGARGVDAISKFRDDLFPAARVRNGVNVPDTSLVLADLLLGGARAISRAPDEARLTRRFIDAMANRVVKAQDRALQRWLGGTPILFVPDARDRHEAYRRSLVAASRSSTRECVMGVVARCREAFGLNIISSELTSTQRSLLLHSALSTGGAGAFDRLMQDTTAGIAVRLSAAANSTLDSVFNAWRAELDARWRPPAQGVPPMAAFSAVAWAGILGLSLVRSRR